MSLAWSAQCEWICFRYGNTEGPQVCDLRFFFEAGGSVISGREVWLWAGPVEPALSLMAAVEHGRGQRPGCAHSRSWLTWGWRPTFITTPVWMVVLLPGTFPLCRFNSASAGVEKPDGYIDPKIGASIAEVRERKSRTELCPSELRVIRREAQEATDG